jgi:hypothetical protein
MEIVWNSYGTPMEPPWNITGATPEQHRSSTLFARLRLPYEPGLRQSLGFQMLQLPRRWAYNRCGIGRPDFETEVLGESDCLV